MEKKEEKLSKLLDLFKYLIKDGDITNEKIIILNDKILIKTCDMLFQISVIGDAYSIKIKNNFIDRTEYVNSISNKNKDFDLIKDIIKFFI